MGGASVDHFLGWLRRRVGAWCLGIDHRTVGFHQAVEPLVNVAAGMARLGIQPQSVMAAQAAARDGLTAVQADSVGAEGTSPAHYERQYVGSRQVVLVHGAHYDVAIGESTFSIGRL